MTAGASFCLIGSEDKERVLRWSGLSPRRFSGLTVPEGLLPPERSEHNLPPAGGHNLRGYQPRPPSPLNPLNLLNLLNPHAAGV